MKDLGNYECDGQIEMTEYLKSQIKCGVVKDLTAWINSQGKAQYTQIGEVVKDAYERHKDSAELAESIMHKVSFETLEAHHGILPISRRGFYRRRGTAQRLMRRREMMRRKFLYKSKIVVH